MGKVAKWALEVMGHNIKYSPQTAIKSKALINFVVDWTESQLSPAPVDQEYCIMDFDGSLMRRGASVGLVFVSPLGVRMKYSICLHFPSSNNVAKYEALINDLKIAFELGIQSLEVRGDSPLVVDQIMKESSCKSETIPLYCQEVQNIEGKFHDIELKHVPRKLHEAADSLAKMESGRETIPFGVFISDKLKPSI